MAYQLVAAEIPYRQVFKRPRRRRLEDSWFREKMDLRIEVVGPEAAPVAYQVRFGSDTSPRLFGYQIRFYEGRFWWPLGGDYNYVVHPEVFAGLLEDGRADLLALLDPSFARCEEWSWDRFPEEYERIAHEWNNIEDHRAAAQRGASKTIFCDDGAFVQAGEPIFYAVPGNDPKRLSIRVGVSDMERESNGESHSEPGPPKLSRKMCARLGFAFGIDELDQGIDALLARGYVIEQGRYSIEVLLERHRPETAPLLCAQELAGDLFTKSLQMDRRGDGLRAGVPIIGAVENLSQVEDLCVEVLGQLLSSAEPIVAYDLLQERRSAKAILNRLDPLGRGTTLSPEADAALAALGFG